jgi:hypothetical protein
METIKLTRKELYDLVWSESILSLSKRFNISDVGLRKLCIRMNIPIPLAGHWVKVKFGKPVKILKFPTKFEGTDIIEIKEFDKGSESAISGESETTIKTKLIKSDPSLDFTLIQDFKNADPLIISAREGFKNKIIELKNNKWYRESELISNHGFLDIRTRDKNIDRALKIANMLIVNLKKRGHNIILSYDGTDFIVNGQTIKFSMMEKSNYVETKSEYSSYSSRVLVANNKLSIKIGRWDYREWVDGKVPLEENIPKIIAKIEEEGLKLKKEHEEREVQRIEYERLKEIARLKLERKTNELMRFNQFLDEAKLYNNVVLMQNYINAVEQQIIANNTTIDKDAEWIIWAKEKLAWYDPTINKTDEILDGVNKTTLKIEEKNRWF